MKTFVTDRTPILIAPVLVSWRHKLNCWRFRATLSLRGLVGLSPPYIELVIEAVDESGPCGLPALSVAHYGLQNGDAMHAPEMCFEFGFAGNAHLNPYYWRNDYVAIEQWSRFIREGNYCYHPQFHAQHESFAKTWDRNLCSQGFAQVFTDKCIVG